MPPSSPAETLRSAIELCIPQRASTAATEVAIPDDVITALQNRGVNDRKEAYTWLADNLSPVDPEHNHALLARLSSCEGFLIDAVLQVKQCIMTTMLGLLDYFNTQERVLGPILLWCREDLLGCPQFQRVEEELARCLCGYGGEPLREDLAYSRRYEPAIPPIVRVDGSPEDLPGGGVRLDISVVVADSSKPSTGPIESRQPRQIPVGERRRSKPLSTDRKPPSVLGSKRPIGDVLGSPLYIVEELLLSEQWSVRMEALASLKSALVNDNICGKSISEEFGASLSYLIERETHRKCLSSALNVVYLAAKGFGPKRTLIASRILLRSLRMVTARRLADGSPQVSGAARSCHEVWLGAEVEEWWEVYPGK
ncbi:hypothetical protein FOZ60_008304 [Perkinsus olseni]|uniref:Uncharacterized protein n=1 Tax=Perkinsus olseni TaxID=32597 RepID=A0A7J6NJS6_PEROL|nr:hypothetical protein FOZ60_008304 [Perkinsus olseni]